MTEVTTHATRVRTLPARSETPATISGAARRASDLGVGAVAIAAEALGGALDRFWPGAAADRDHATIGRRVLRAATGAALVTERRVLDAAVAVELLTQQTVDVARGLPVVRDVLVGVDASLDRWSDRASAETGRREQALATFVGALVPAIVDGVLERVDFGAVVARVPLAEILGAIDLDQLLDAVDLNAVLEQIDVDHLLERIDVDGLLNRIDVDAMMSRVDLDALLGRMDLGPIVENVLDEVDVGGIVRESTGSITGDAMDSARISAMRLDSFIGRVADRMLLRRESARGPAPDTVEPEPEPEPDAVEPGPGPEPESGDGAAP